MKAALQVIPLIILLSLGGCAGIEDHHVSYLQSKCAIYGFERGTDAHARCYRQESTLWWDQVKERQL